MRRPALEKRERVFNSAILVARDIGMAEGLRGLTARRIARRVGCSVGTIYNMFENLDTLILHVNGKTLDGLYDSLAGLELTEEPEAAVRRVIKSYHDYTVANPRLWSILFEHIWPQDYELPDWYTAKIQRLLGVLASALKPLLPDATEAQRLQAAAVLWSGLYGINSLAVSGKIGLITSDSAIGTTDLMIKSFLRGLPTTSDQVSLLKT